MESKKRSKSYTFTKKTLQERNSKTIFEVCDFVVINPPVLRIINLTELNFSIWIKGTDQLVEFLSPLDDAHDKINRLSKLLSVISRYQSISNLMIHNGDIDNFQAHIRAQRLAQINQDHIDPVVTDSYMKLANVSDRICTTIDHGTIEEAQQIAMETVMAVQDNKNLLSMLSDLMSESSGLYDHTAIVTLLATSIGQKLGFSENNLKIMALGCLFHDIGLTELDITDWYTKKIGPSDRKIYALHPQVGVEKLSEASARLSVQLPEEIFMITMQHHEKFNGSGFPNGRKGQLSKGNPNGIHVFASVVSLADHFSTYFVDLDGKVKYDKDPAIKAINRLDGYFDPVALHAFNSLVNYNHEKHYFQVTERAI